MWSLILGAMPWNKVFELAFSLIGKAISNSDSLKELEIEWLEFTKNINRKKPVKMSDDIKEMILHLEERDRLEKIEVEKLKQQNKNYEENNKALYSKNLELEDKLNKTQDYHQAEF